MSTFHHVCILSEETEPFRQCTGPSDDLKLWLDERNSGKCTHTSEFDLG